MDTLSQILGIVVWPITIIVIVAMLRAPLSQLVPTLKKLKYKELELEFEKEASKILAEAERDIPEPEKIEKFSVQAEKPPRAMFRLAIRDPAIEIIESWRDLEIAIRSLAGSEAQRKSIGVIVRDLARSNVISQETAKVILDLAALRNKVAHSNEEVISSAAAISFLGTVQRVKSILGEKNA